jgi:transmembrane protein EpsG
MTILWLNLIAVFLLALAARYFSVQSAVIAYSVNPNKLLAIFAALCLILISGLRNNIGDTFFYMHSYETTDFLLSIYKDQKDIGFNIFQYLLKMVSDDPQLLIFVTAFITNALIIKAFYNYARLFELAVYVYITSGAFIVSMNGMRQYLAAAIIFAATKYMLEGSWKRYICVVLLASLFHQSALIMIPIYFFVRRKAWTGTTLVLLAVAILIVSGFNQFQDILFSALKDTSYGEYQNFQEGGANVIRVAFYAFPLIIAFIGRDKLRMYYPQIDVFVNLSLIGVILMIISTQNWIFARMAIYFTLYQIVLVAWVIKVFRQKDQKLIYLVLLMIYLIFFFYETVITLGIEYRSDYITWFT